MILHSLLVRRDSEWGRNGIGSICSSFIALVTAVAFHQIKWHRKTNLDFEGALTWDEYLANVDPALFRF
jgi:hypothetical protein